MLFGIKPGLQDPAGAGERLLAAGLREVHTGFASTCSRPVPPPILVGFVFHSDQNKGPPEPSTVHVNWCSGLGAGRSPQPGGGEQEVGRTPSGLRRLHISSRLSGPERQDTGARVLTR